jgi:bacterioferritin-associated ferredoxin
VWVCLCKAVSSGSIVDAIDAGARTVKGIGRINGAGTDCGKCTTTIYVLIEQHRREASSEEKQGR